MEYQACDQLLQCNKKIMLFLWCAQTIHIHYCTYLILLLYLKQLISLRRLWAQVLYVLQSTTAARKIPFSKNIVDIMLTSRSRRYFSNVVVPILSLTFRDINIRCYRVIIYITHVPWAQKIAKRHPNSQKRITANLLWKALKKREVKSDNGR